MYKLTLSDGTVINAILNGNNYITEEDVSNVDFSDKNFTSITIVEGENEPVEMTHLHCSNVFTQEDGTHIIFRPKTADEIKIDELNAVIDNLLAFSLGSI